jgi:uncharacterized protein
MVFGTDWPGMPGIARNARAAAELCPARRPRRWCWPGNAARVYNLKLET